MSSQAIYTITELNHLVNNHLAKDFTGIKIEGEISNLARPSSGHIYFTLKDNQSAISCSLFKGYLNKLMINTTDLANGSQVVATGNLSIYAPRGQYQIIINQLTLAGVGNLEQQYRELLTKLQDEGLFTDTHKLSLPAQVKTIGIISSSTGAAIHDAITTIQRRNPLVNIIIYPTLVQGDNAPENIRSQLLSAIRRRDADILLLIRGGGSIEDLWAFNNEALARLIYECPIPTISGVGHEIDFTICDFVCDVRVATPTAAAEMACPQLQPLELALQQRLQHNQQRLLRLIADDKQQLIHWHYRVEQNNPQRQLQSKMQKLDDLQNRLIQLLDEKIARAQQKIIYLSQRVKAYSPLSVIHQQHAMISDIDKNIHKTISNAFDRKKSYFYSLCTNMNNLNPLNVLSRGYSLVTDTHGQVIQNAKTLKVNDKAIIKLQTGTLYCTVNRRRLS